MAHIMYNPASPLITVSELRGLLAEDDGGAGISAEARRAAPVVLDVRWTLPTGPDRAAFDAGHIPGARFVDLDAALAAPPGHGGRHPLPDPEVFAEAMRAAGVNSGTAVVVYDAGNSVPASRAWWLLRHFGHADVRVLDGGYARWTSTGGPTTASHSSRAAAGADADELHRGDRGDFTPGPPLAEAVDADVVPAFAERGALLDARPPERFRGEVEPVDPVAGHIPGARNAPAGANLAGDSTFLSPAELRAHFTGLIGPPPGPSGPVASYCGSGINAAQEVLALGLAGYDAVLYPGSWSQWITDPDRPVETGAPGAPR